MSERDDAIKLANAVLGKADRFGAVDPDGDMAVLARQLLRAHEEIERLRTLVGAADLGPSFRDITKDMSHKSPTDASDLPQKPTLYSR